MPNSQLGGDGDFGGSPTIFGPYVGACDKNGIYYALDRSTMQVAWETRIGAKSSSASPAQCSAAAIYDGSHLYMAGDPTTINGVSYRGSVLQMDPGTGATLWQPACELGDRQPFAERRWRAGGRHLRLHHHP